MGRIELPYEGKYIYQPEEGHGITSDTQFLVERFLAKTSQDTGINKNLLEVGTGIGIIALMIALARKEWQFTGMEVQIPLYLQAIENRRLTGTNVRFILGDFRKYYLYLKDERFSYIVANPPYYQAGKGRMAGDINRNISRTELLCDMNDILAGIAALLKPQGEAFVLYPASRETELYDTASKYRLLVEREYIAERQALKTKSSSGKEKILFILRPERGKDAG